MPKTKTSNNTIRAAIAQVPPVYLDLASSLDILAEWTRKAALEGARLVVFGETWLAGYPAWLDYCPNSTLWNHPATKEVYARLRRNSLVAFGPEHQRLATLAREHGVVLVVGINERVDAGPGNGTLYNSLLTFDESGELINHHRKLVPTFTERVIWGPGDSRGLAVRETSAGRLGGLICWEHWMPLARQALHVDGETIHVAVWPTVHEMHQVASRHYAFEGRCFVLAAGLLMRNRDLPAGLDVPEKLVADPEGWLLRGGSAVIGPDGGYLREPVYEEERLIVVDLDLARLDEEKMTLDVSGHYHRPDIFDFEVHRPGGSGSR